MPVRTEVAIVTTPTEHAECIALAKWLDRHGICYTHVPLGGTDAAAGSRARAIGAKRGVPDYLIFDRPPLRDAMSSSRPRTAHIYVTHGVALEMKRRTGGRVSSAQEEWLRRLSHRGWVPIVAKGAGHAVEQLVALGYGGAPR